MSTDSDDPGNGTPTDAERPLPGAGLVSDVTDVTPKGPADPRHPAAKLDYEMGLPLRSIAAKVGVTEGAIRLWAKTNGWKRGTAKPSIPTVRAAKVEPTPKPAKVTAIRPDVVIEGAATTQDTTDYASEATTQPQAVRSEPECVVERPLDEAFRARVRELLENPTRDEAADVAARAVVQVVMTHRRGVQKLQGIVDKLAGQLEFASETTIRDLTAQAIEEAYPGPHNAKRRNALLGLIDLRSHASTAKDLATAMTKLTLLERQAFGLATSDDPTPPPAPEALPEAKTDVFDAIREKARLRIASATDYAEVKKA